MPGTRKLGKTTDQRTAMLRQQVTDFLDNGKMETTITRCKEIRPLAEKMITLGKKGDLAAYRKAMAFITREDAPFLLFPTGESMVFSCEPTAGSVILSERSESKDLRSSLCINVKSVPGSLDFISFRSG